MSTADPNASFEQQWKLYGPRLDYARNYFDFHAKQRTTMFNFFLLFSGLMLNGCFLLFQQSHYFLLLFASLLSMSITIMFLFLERRNEELVHVAEDILRAIEKDVLFLNFKRSVKWPMQRGWLGGMAEEPVEIDLGIFIREDQCEARGLVSKYRHGVWLARVEIAIAILYLVFAVVSVYRLFCGPGGFLL